jgi:hypothetical protein
MFTMSPLGRIGARLCPDGHVRGYAADLPHGLPPASQLHGREVAYAQVKRRHQPRTDPYPPDWSQRITYGALHRFLLVRLSASLAGPAPSGSTGTSRRCQGCSHPGRPPKRRPRLPSASAPCCDKGPGEVSHLPEETPRLMAHVDVDPGDADEVEELRHLARQFNRHAGFLPAPRRHRHASGAPHPRRGEANRHPSCAQGDAATLRLRYPLPVTRYPFPAAPGARRGRSSASVTGPSRFTVTAPRGSSGSLLQGYCVRRRRRGAGR